MKNSRLVNILCIVLYSFLFILYVSYAVLFSGSCNHSSMPLAKYFLLVIFLFFIIAIYFLFSKSKTNRKLNIFFIVFLLLSLAVLIMFNLFNVMISYETWIERAMPAKYKFQVKNNDIDKTNNQLSGAQNFLKISLKTLDKKQKIL